MLRRNLITIAIISLILALTGNAFGQTNKRKRSTAKTAKSKSKTKKATESTKRTKGETTLGDIVVSKESKLAGIKDGTSNTVLGEPDTASLDASSPKLQESTKRTIKANGQNIQDEGTNNRQASPNTGKPLAKTPTEQKIDPNKSFQGTTMEGGDIRTKDTTNKPTGPNIPKPEIKKPITKIEKPTKTEKPKRANKRPRRSVKGNN